MATSLPETTDSGIGDRARLAASTHCPVADSVLGRQEPGKRNAGIL